MIENMEEGILCLGYTCKLLYIVNDKNIYSLIESNEIIEVICSYRVSVLHLEQMCRDIKNSLFRVQFFYTCTDSVDKMCLTNSRDGPYINNGLKVRAGFIATVSAPF